MKLQNDRYWEHPWSLVDGCTPCSPGCDHCWSAGMTHRFVRTKEFQDDEMERVLTDSHGHFNGHILVHPDRLDIPARRRKPTVYVIWNDLFHEAVLDEFRHKAYATMRVANHHIYLILTKRSVIVEKFLRQYERVPLSAHPHIWHGLTVCNQAELDEKGRIFDRVPGKKFYSLEPLLSNIDFSIPGIPFGYLQGIDAVILGGETGPGARPMHPDWVRSIRDQCAAAGTSFFFKGWGEYFPCDSNHPAYYKDVDMYLPYGAKRGRTRMIRVGHKNAGRLLDGRTHDDLPWR